MRINFLKYYDNNAFPGRVSSTCCDEIFTLFIYPVDSPKVVLRKTLGLPLAEGDLKALFRRLDKVRHPGDFVTLASF